jgi:MFS family permease
VTRNGARSAFRAVLPSRPEARRLVLGTLLGAIGQGMTLPFLFIYLTEVRHLSSTMVGLVVGWMGLLSLVLSGPSGALIDRFGARAVMLPLYLIDAVGVASYGWVHSTWQAFGSATMAAVGGAVLWGGQNTLLTTITTPEERQRVFGLSFAILNLGIGGGGIIAGFIADVHHVASFQLIYLINAGAALIPGVILLSLGQVGHPLAVERSADAVAGGYRDVFANRAFRRFIVFALLIMVSGYAQIEIGFPAFASLVGGVPTRVIAWGLAANTMTIVAAQLFVLRWMHGRSRSRGLAMVGILMASSWLILGLGAWAKGAGAAVPIVGVLLCGSVFACGETLMSPVMPAITNALATDELRGRYNAMSSMVWGVTGIIGPLTAAPLIGHHLGAVWIGLIVAGSLSATMVALSLRGLLTPEQDGRLAAPVAVARVS